MVPSLWVVCPYISPALLSQSSPYLGQPCRSKKMAMEDRMNLNWVQKWLQYGRFPWKFIFHALLTAACTAMVHDAFQHYHLPHHHRSFRFILFALHIIIYLKISFISLIIANRCFCKQTIKLLLSLEWMQRGTSYSFLLAYVQVIT